MCQVSQFRVLLNLCREGHTWRSRMPDHVRIENLVSAPGWVMQAPGGAGSCS